MSLPQRTEKIESQPPYNAMMYPTHAIPIVSVTMLSVKSPNENPSRLEAESRLSTLREATVK